MLKNLQIILKCLFKIGWTEIVEEATMGVMFFVHDQKMTSASTSMKTKPAVFMRPSQISVQPFLGGMKIWSQIGLGTRPFNSVQA
jgi:hypothetical protein